jgi:hypothetical protein
MRKLVGLLGLLLFVGAGAVGGVELWHLAGSTYDRLTSTAHIAPGLVPRMTPTDAESVTYGFLNRMRLQLPDPAQHVAPYVTGTWAVTADQAAALDGCIPTGMGTGIVWVTRGRGDYLNLTDHPWSHGYEAGSDLAVQACTASAQAGVMVIDDATGQILGVYPDSGALNPHPSPLVSPAPGASSPLVSLAPGASPPAAVPASPGAAASPDGAAPPAVSGSPDAPASPGASPSPAAD